MWCVFSLGPDIIEECQAVAAIPPDGGYGWTPLFEPTEFNDEHGPLHVASYQLSTVQLKEWAERVVKIRSAIKEKARTFCE